MCYAYTREGQAANGYQEAHQIGFSAFDELINDRGEAAVMIEVLSLEEMKITGYTLPRRSATFSEGEVRNAFLAQSVTSPAYEDADREKLEKFLEDSV